MLVVVMAAASPLLEGAYRASTLLLHRITVARDRDALYHIEPGGPLVYRLRANVRGTARFADDPSRQWSYSTNAQGFRGRALETRRGDGRRVIALGDSYTFGWGIDDASQTWPGRLEGFLDDVEVFNAGVPGYNTVQESHLLDELLARGEVDVVVLAFVVNDAEPQHTVVNGFRACATARCTRGSWIALLRPSICSSDGPCCRSTSTCTRSTTEPASPLAA